MPSLLTIDWNINPLVFLEFFVVLAFGIGWLILEYVARRIDNRRKEEEARLRKTDDPA